MQRLALAKARMGAEMRRHRTLGPALALAVILSAFGRQAVAWTGSGPYGQDSPFAVNVPSWIHFDPHGRFYIDGYYPDRALRLDQGGNATIHCQVTDKGTLQGCLVVSEFPQTLGFGQAALVLSGRLSLDVGPAATAPVVDGQVNIPVSFVLSGPDIHAVVTAGPTREQVAAAYPKSASGEGRATIRCGMGDGGVLLGCFVKTETPAKQGFGDAALSLADLFRVGVIESDPRKILIGRFDISVAFHDPSKPARPPHLAAPVWIQDFNPDHLAAVYPAKAKVAGVLSGRAVVRCVVLATGVLTGCQAVEETPTGLGFGDALVAVTGEMVMSPWSDGEPVAGVVIRFPLVLNAPTKP